MSIDINGLQLMRNGRYILRDVSAVFDMGKLHFCVGRNGSGKSSLLKCIAGIEKEGENISIMGNLIATLSAKVRAQKIAFVSQMQSVPVEVPVFEYILMGRFPYLNWLGNFDTVDKAIAQKYIALLNLETLVTQNVQTLSGGELQKVCIARALTQETPILLLDEPAQSLDPFNKKWLYDFLPTLIQHGKTIICITHDIEYLPENAMLWGVANGQIVWQGEMGKNRADIWEKVFGIKY